MNVDYFGLVTVFCLYSVRIRHRVVCFHSNGPHIYSNMRERRPILQRRRSVALATEPSGNSTRGLPFSEQSTCMADDARDESSKNRETDSVVEQRDVSPNLSLSWIDNVDINKICVKGGSSILGPTPTALCDEYCYVKIGPSSIGRGQFSRVYRVIDAKTMTLCAVKEIKLSNESNKTHADAELAFVKNLSESPMRHENIVSFKQAFMSSASATVSIVMEYASLGSLQDLIDTASTIIPQGLVSSADTCINTNFGASFALPLAWISSIGKAIFSGLDFLHNERHIAHGDIKPSNILLFKSGDCKISDFGCCKSLDKNGGSIITSSEDNQPFGGTLAFMSPEQLLGTSDVGIKSDVFSAGMTIMECVESSDQERAGETFWDVLEIIEMRVKAIDKRSDLPGALRNFLALCFDEEKSRPPPKELLQNPFLHTAKNAITDDDDFHRLIQVISPLPRVMQRDIDLALQKAGGQMRTPAAASSSEELVRQLRPFVTL